MESVMLKGEKNLCQECTLLSEVVDSRWRQLQVPMQ